MVSAMTPVCGRKASAIVEPRTLQLTALWCVLTSCENNTSSSNGDVFVLLRIGRFDKHRSLESPIRERDTELRSSVHRILLCQIRLVCIRRKSANRSNETFKLSFNMQHSPNLLTNLRTEYGGTIANTEKLYETCCWSENNWCLEIINGRRPGPMGAKRVRNALLDRFLETNTRKGL